MPETSRLVRATETRLTETPNATMTTLASPSLGMTDGISLWRVAMQAGSTGPLHAFDSEQIWSVLDGNASIALDGDVHELAAGDTIVVPAHALRQVTAPADVRLLVCGRGDAVASVAGEAAPRGTPPWIA
jgi:quercetin dioxygenase-like cupin family protein